MQSGASKAIIAAVRKPIYTFIARGMDVEKWLSLSDGLCQENEIEGRVTLRGDTDDAQHFKYYLGRQLEQYYEGRRGDVKLKGVSAWDKIYLFVYLIFILIQLTSNCHPYPYIEQGPWGVLDFIDIPKSLAARLTDDDLYAILVCIDARNNLKHLKLTHCLNIIGHGLGPLRRSTVLEKIDMNLCMDHTIPRVLDVAKLSEEVISHIIHDILGVEGSSLWRLRLPVKWYNNFEVGGWLDQFLVQHRAILNNSSMCCYFGFDGTKKDFLRCNKFCDYELNDWVDICPRCEEHYQRLTNFFVCEDCDMICCSECEEIATCAICEIAYCGGCGGHSANPVFMCDDYMNHDPYCQDCRLSDCRDGTNDCDACKALIFDRLLIAHEAEIAAQREETDRLRQEVEELRERNA